MGTFKTTAIIFLSFILLPSAFAACEYADIERYTETGPALCLQGSNTYYAQALIISDFVNGTRPSFTVTNPNDYQVKVFFNYSVNGARIGTNFFGITIDGKDQEVIDEMCYTDSGAGNCSINPNSITYFLTVPRSMDPCITTVPKSRDVCNKPCTTDADCSESKCNIAGFCGPKKVVPCPEGKTNCNDIACLTPGQKIGGEAYLCQFECKSNTGIDGVCKAFDGDACEKDVDCLSGICNAIKQCGSTLICPAGTDNCNDQGCFAPETKSFGQKYTCEWECKSNRGLYGVCQISTGAFLGIIFVLILLGGLWTWYFAAYKRKKEEDSLKDAEAKRIEIERTIDSKKEDISALEEKKQKMELDAVKTLHQIEELHAKIHSADGRATKAWEEALAKAEKENKARVDEIKKITEQVTTKKEQLGKETEELAKQEQELENRSRAYYLKRYRERYGERIYVPEGSDYIRFKDSGTGKDDRLHIYIYKSHYDTILPGCQVHHIDANSFNNEIWNLIAVPKNLHDSRSKHPNKIRHGRISCWMNGYQELKNSGLTDEIFKNHPAVEKHYEEEMQKSKAP